MELRIDRIQMSLRSTIGRLYIKGEQVCQTLEDRDRGLTQSMSPVEIRAKKIKGATAIPRGRYEVAWEVSPKFKSRVWALPYGGRVPRLLNVPGFDGVLIHPGNTPEDTAGCILVGTWDRKREDALTGSQAAYRYLLDGFLVPAFEAGERVWLTVR